MRPALTILSLLISLDLLAPALAQSPAAQPPAAESRATVPAAPAATKFAGYDVELVIFRIASSQGSPEDWAAAAALAPPVPGSGEDSAGDADAGTNGRFIRSLGSNEFQLTEIASKLKASGIYPVVAHVGWVQNASPWGRKASMSLQQLGIDIPGLAGSVTLERGEFLHLGLALDLTVASPPAGLSAAPGTTFTLNDSHRVKPYERNYFDSPAFGVIALVTPAQRPVR